MQPSAQKRFPTPCSRVFWQLLVKGPSIYDVHMEGGQTQVDACGRGSQAPCERTPRKLKSTDIILSSSHAKKLAPFYQNFILAE